MYCKKCGKKLPDGARFCDRCNMSVRKQNGKKELIDELKEERLARRQAKAMEERLKKIKKVKSKRVKTAVTVVILIVLAGVLSAVGGWFMVNLDSKPIAQEEKRTKEPEEPTATPEIVTIGKPELEAVTPTAEPVATAVPATLNTDGYYVVNLGGTEFAYPMNFKTDESGIGNLLSLCDPAGDAVLIVSKTATGSSAAELMKSYISGMAGVEMESEATGNGYEVSLKIGDEIYHKKSCVFDGYEIYYEINYPAGTEKRKQYIEAIAYMDDFFKAE